MQFGIAGFPQGLGIPLHAVRQFVYSTPGTFQYTPTAGTKNILVFLTGSGAGGNYSSSGAGGPVSGAGAGETVIALLNVATYKFPVQITVPSKGTGGTVSGPVLATNGSPALFGTILSAAGGLRAVTPPSHCGGSGGIGPGLHIPGGDGGGFNNDGANTYGGEGGSSFWGGGSPGGLSATPTPAIVPGSGGASGTFISPSTRFDGAAGGDGLCMIFEFG